MLDRYAIAKMILFTALISSVLLLSIVLYSLQDSQKNANALEAGNYPESAVPSPTGPIIKDPNLKAEVVFRGLAYPTKMAFLGPNDILVLEKEKGTVQRIVNGEMLPEPLLDVNVATYGHRGMLGIAISNTLSSSSTSSLSSSLCSENLKSLL
jgi:aldose sugar dehydrogenase